DTRVCDIKEKTEKHNKRHRNLNSLRTRTQHLRIPRKSETDHSGAPYVLNEDRLVREREYQQRMTLRNIGRRC
ncbi:hypothetical protein NPIL_438491, partial [Nephila pilipes]